jgi:RNase H-like domain found in reverse transcriptase
LPLDNVTVPLLPKPELALTLLGVRTLEVDASQYVIGAILQQMDDSGKLCAVGYYSKALMDAERGYDVHDRELLALVKGLEQW